MGDEFRGVVGSKGSMLKVNVRLDYLNSLGVSLSVCLSPSVARPHPSVSLCIFSSYFDSLPASATLAYISVTGIVGSTTGSNYYVRILSTLDHELLKPNSSVALHKV